MLYQTTQEHEELRAKVREFAEAEAGVGAGVGLGQAEGPDLFAGAQVGQVLFLLLLGAEGVDGVGAQRGVGGEDHPHAAVHRMRNCGAR